MKELTKLEIFEMIIAVADYLSANSFNHLRDHFWLIIDSLKAFLSVDEANYAKSEEIAKFQAFV